MFRITKEFHFSASHHLSHLPADHQCASLLGHNCIVVVVLTAPDLNADGVARDYHELKPLKANVACCVRFVAPEFTSLFPMTGQPDFAHLVIDHVPGGWLVQSKSFKLYLGSFRNHGAFHEDCTVFTACRLVEFLAPQWLRIGGDWYPRGGIAIDVFRIPDRSTRPIEGAARATAPA